MILYLLDTNAVSVAVHRRSSTFDRRLDQVGGNSIAISSITYGEIIYGLKWKVEARRLALSMSDFLLEVTVLPWTEATGEVYGALRAELRRSGESLAPSTCSSPPTRWRQVPCSSPRIRRSGRSPA